MKSNTATRHPADLGKQKQFHLGLPVVVVPLITLFFWLLGGGTGITQTVEKPQGGLNLELPSATLAPDSAMDKMAFYERADHDSASRAEQIKNDPYFHSDSSGQFGLEGTPVDQNEQRIQEKLSQLNSALNSSGSGQAYVPDQNYQRENVSNRADLDRLQNMMGQVQGGGGADPEMQQINSVLGQILDIQHPDRVQERIKANSAKNRGKVFLVSTNKKENSISVLGKQPKGKIAPVTGFYSLEEPEKKNDEQNAIQAVIYESQTLSDGSIIKLRLLNEVYISGQLIPKNTFVYAVAHVSGERLMLTITNVRSEGSIYPVNLSVYDLDGLDGLYIPGAIGREVSKSSADQALQSVTMGTTAIDPSLGVQAMGAGIEAAKSLLSKKVKMVKVTVKAGYFVLLKNADEENNNQ